MCADTSPRPKQTNKQANLRQIYFNQGGDKGKEWLGSEAGCIFFMMNQNCEEATEDNVGQKDSEHFVMNVISQWQTAALRDSLGIRDMLAIQTFI